MVHGKNFIGAELSAKGTKNFHATNPQNDTQLEGTFTEATTEEINQACRKANRAFPLYRKKTAGERADLLYKIAEKIENHPTLVKRTCEESGLPEARIIGERGRTCGQLRLFANLIIEGSWVDAHIDIAQPDRKPLPKPDLRKMNVAIGPVAVFGASNFPLAFSTAGGDAASALAAGCPIVVKAHPAHPGCAEIVAEIILEAIQETNMPEGTFSMVNGASAEVGQTLIKNPAIKAVGFTGSVAAGRAIFNSAATRPEPIPVYAEMGSSNPVFILPEKIKDEALPSGIVSSVCMGAGQFCTNPGMLVAIKSDATDQLLEKIATLIKEQPSGTTVHASIKKSYDRELNIKTSVSNVKVLAQSNINGAHPSTSVAPTLFITSAKNYFANLEELKSEVFGPCTMAIICDNEEEMLEFAQNLEGHLTSSLQATNNDLEEFKNLLSSLETRCGRLIINQFPTGVEVCPSMQHGGPYPASTDTRTTSVGTGAIHRFVRPVAYQNFPQGLLPDELRDNNPLGLIRTVDGKHQH